MKPRFIVICFRACKETRDDPYNIAGVLFDQTRLVWPHIYRGGEFEFLYTVDGQCTVNFSTTTQSSPADVNGVVTQPQVQLVLTALVLELLFPGNSSACSIKMAWNNRPERDSIDVEDEAVVGLITAKPESATTHKNLERRSWITKSSLSVVMLLSNVAWAGLCLMLSRELHISQSHAPTNHERLEADFGTSTFITWPSQQYAMLSDHLEQ